MNMILHVAVHLYDTEFLFSSGSSTTLLPDKCLELDISHMSDVPANSVCDQ